MGSPPATEPNKDERHAYMREYDRERRKRAKRLFHWSLDIPPDDDDDVNIQANRGMGWKELAVAAAAGFGALHYFNQPEQTDQRPPPPYSAPVDSEYEVRFFDRDGNPINVPHISQRPAPHE